MHATVLNTPHERAKRKPAMAHSPAPTNEPPRNRTLEIARLIWENTDADHGITIKEIQGDTAVAHNGEQLNGYVAGNLAEIGCPTDRKTVALAIAQLAAAGLPITKVRNGNRHEYRLERHIFSDHELELVFAAVQSSNALTERTGAQITAHLNSLASAHQRERLANRTLVAGHVRRQSDSAFEKLDPIYEAIASKRRLFFRYYEYNAEKKRVPRVPCDHDVVPAVVAYSDGFYYLIAYNDAADRGGLRTYRIDHMSAIRALDSKAAPIDDVRDLQRNPQAHLDRLFGMYSGEEVTVTLHVKAHLMRAVIDRFGMDVRSFPAKDDPEHAARVYVNVSLSPTFFSWILQFNGDVRIEAPARARDALRDFLASNARMYEGESAD